MGARINVGIATIANGSRNPLVGPIELAMVCPVIIPMDLSTARKARALPLSAAGNKSPINELINGPACLYVNVMIY